MAGANRLIVRHKVSIIQLLPESYKARMERIPGVSLVTHQTWFGGIYQDPRTSSCRARWCRRSSWRCIRNSFSRRSRRQAWLRTRTGAIVGRKTAKRFQWKIGDKVPILSSIWAKNDGRTDVGIRHRGDLRRPR